MRSSAYVRMLRNRDVDNTQLSMRDRLRKEEDDQQNASLSAYQP